MPIDESGKINGVIGIETSAKQLSPHKARAVAATLVNMANEVEGKPNYRVSLRKRWEPGGVRDKENRLIGFCLGVGLTIIVTVLTGAFDSWVWWIYGVWFFVLSGAVYGLRVHGDRKDIEDEFRERVHGETIDQSTGLLPWEVR
ncbi:hypothetical protein QLT00_gp14 [Gordonia phage Commandaria]|uniref:Uncharacterized protein n=1 Tax=Gordonia phage Commandaria TaxID=3038364 RepID=A0AAF0K062_9CAUD|nr:hypothetical protein QLT00_gp14 [Gordonia phage Commandaria]WGH20797.1 hypothetical protein [Gordonia phage Commandaria]